MIRKACIHPVNPADPVILSVPDHCSLMAESSFPKSRRLLKSAEFERVFQRRRSQADGMLTMYACENDASHARLGLVVSRKCGDATERNRWKRCLREAFRLVQHELPAGIDLVVLPRAGAVPTMPRVRQSLCQLSAQLGRRLASSGASRPPADKGTPP